MWTLLIFKRSPVISFLTIKFAFKEASPSTMIFLSNVAFSANCATELKLASCETANLASTSVSPFKVVAPSTRRVESNDASLIACRVALKVATSVTSNVLFNVVAPITSNVFFNEEAPATFKVEFKEASPSTMIFLSNVAFSAN